MSDEVKKEISQVKKRDGTIVPFDKKRITDAIYKAAMAVGGTDKEMAEGLSNYVVAIVKKRLSKQDEIPTVEEIQDVVEKVLIEKDMGVLEE